MYNPPTRNRMLNKKEKVLVYPIDTLYMNSIHVMMSEIAQNFSLLSPALRMSKIEAILSYITKTPANSIEEAILEPSRIEFYRNKDKFDFFPIQTDRYGMFFSDLYYFLAETTSTQVDAPVEYIIMNMDDFKMPEIIMRHAHTLPIKKSTDEEILQIIKRLHKTMDITGFILPDYKMVHKLAEEMEDVTFIVPRVSPNFEIIEARGERILIFKDQDKLFHREINNAVELSMYDPFTRFYQEEIQ
jgi:hypothetical protein